MSSRNAAILRWSLLALSGLVVAIAVGVAAAALTSSRIGLSSEPIRAGEALAPKSAQREDHHGGRGRGRDHPEDDPHRGGDSTTSTSMSTSTTTTAPPPVSTAPAETTTTGTTTSEETTAEPPDDSEHSEGEDDD